MINSGPYRQSEITKTVTLPWWRRIFAFLFAARGQTATVDTGKVWTEPRCSDGIIVYVKPRGCSGPMIINMTRDTIRKNFKAITDELNDKDIYLFDYQYSIFQIPAEHAAEVKNIVVGAMGAVLAEGAR